MSTNERAKSSLVAASGLRDNEDGAVRIMRKEASVKAMDYFRYAVASGRVMQATSRGMLD